MASVFLAAQIGGKNDFALSSKFDGVADQVQEDLTGTRDITEDPLRHPRINLSSEFYVLLCSAAGEEFETSSMQS